MSHEPNSPGAPRFCSVYYGINERFELEKHRPNIVIDGPGSGRPFAHNAKPWVTIAPVTSKRPSKKALERAQLIQNGTRTFRGPPFTWDIDGHALFFLPFCVQRWRCKEGMNDPGPRRG
jgi:hypothetical protein